MRRITIFILALLLLIPVSGWGKSAKETSGLFPIEQDGKWGFIDKTGRIVIKPQFDEAVDFSEGLARVKIGDKWGFIDEMGKIVIEPQFVDKFSEETIFLDRSFSEGLAAMNNDSKLGFIDKTGRIVIEPQFVSVWPFSEGLSRVTMDGSTWGFIDKTGKIVIKPQFNGVGDFHEGLATADGCHEDEEFLDEVSMESCFIDKTGKIVYISDGFYLDDNRDF